MGKSGSETLQRWNIGVFLWKDIRFHQQGEHRLPPKSLVFYKRQPFPALSPEGFEPFSRGTLFGWEWCLWSPSTSYWCLTSNLGRKNTDWKNTLERVPVPDFSPPSTKVKFLSISKLLSFSIIPCGWEEFPMDTFGTVSSFFILI